MASTSYIEICEKSLCENISFTKSFLSENVVISAVVKGNAYGHGVAVIIPIFENSGITHFSVFSSPEAKNAYKCKKESSTLLIMGFVYPEDYKWVIKKGVEFCVNELSSLKLAVSTAHKLNKKAIIHLDIETGMNRTGLSLTDLKDAIKIVKKNSDLLIVRGITSHLAGAESIANHLRITKQMLLFRKRIRYIENSGINFEIRHIACSAAALNYPNSQFDMIRTGILLYGYWPTRETFINWVHKTKQKISPLKRVIRWKSFVMSIKNVKQGEFVGYGLGYQASRNSKIMVVPVGYANGYSRSLSNNGHVLVNSERSPVIGTVNMNMIICDISEISGIKIGDEVVLIGKQGENEITFASFAEMNNSLNYEILARLPGNIQRVRL